MKRARVLIVDDDPGLLHAIMRLLSKRYEVYACPNPDEALRQIEQSAFDVALLDVRMPQMSGFELLARLRSRRPDLDVIIMTGSVHELDAQLVRAIRAEAYYFIQKPFDREVLHTLVERCIELRRLREENRAHTQRLEHELDVARRFQRSLLPPERATLRRVQVFARYLPRDTLCGDYYDYAECASGAASLIVADVSGHGASAAMLMGIVKSAYQAARAEDFEPLAVVQRVAQSMQPFGTTRFVTLLCARLDQARGLLEYANAGHPTGLLWRGDGATLELESNGPLIGSSIPGLQWEQTRLPLHAGDQLFVYTDGLVESELLDGRLTPKRVAAELCQRGASAALLDHFATLLEQAGARVDDDVTLLAARVD